MFDAEAPILEEWDRALQVSCQLQEMPYTVLNTGVSVPMLGTTNVPPARIPLPEVTLKVVYGRDYRATSADVLHVGEYGTIVLSVSDTYYWDIKVHACMAHDGTGYNVVNLFDERGCPVATKLVESFKKATEPHQQGEGSVFAHFKAFKFPDKPSVYFQCTVEICFEQCREDECSSRVYDTREQLTYHRLRKRDINHQYNENMANGTSSDMRDLYRSVNVLIPGDQISKEDTKSILFSEKTTSALCVNRNAFVIGLLILCAMLTASLAAAVIFYVKLRYSAPKPLLDNVQISMRPKHP
ncbi:PREDICTED: uncharacterized protein LOC106806582 [Priapulus caudatus]|uniref:Uncharacterized protein LOC106806582 n=1 Tax=Priapulus caudatus TaxID=37621 RepID=A0ABM1DVT9_PRICU|nr:PREDICTED: uncharacterized protein LOC106806582 [Priapulus caudatus]